MKSVCRLFQYEDGTVSISTSLIDFCLLLQEHILQMKTH